MSQQQGNTPHYQPQQIIVNARQSVNGLGVASLVLGILGLLTSYFGLGAIFGIIGLILGVIGFCVSGPHVSSGSAIVGIILCIVSSFLGVLVFSSHPPVIGGDPYQKSNQPTQPAIIEQLPFAVTAELAGGVSNTVKTTKHDELRKWRSGGFLQYELVYEQAGVMIQVVRKPATSVWVAGDATDATTGESLTDAEAIDRLLGSSSEQLGKGQ